MGVWTWLITEVGASIWDARKTHGTEALRRFLGICLQKMLDNEMAGFIL